ncbi:MAG: tetrahydrofolate dehydrogenase/cyclohydrolase catalytic domain-containing protein [Undibacterium sp.]
MQLLSGKPIADKVLDRAALLIQTEKVTPGLAVVMVGADPASEIYVGLKEKAAERIGVHFEKHVLPRETATETVRSLIRELNTRPEIHGIIVQLPLPEAIDTDAVIAAIDPKKDADGFHPETVRSFLSGESKTPPVFPRAILALLQSTKLPLPGKSAIVFANSELFANVMKEALQSIGIAADSSIDWGDREAISRLREYDIVISAKGAPNFLKGDMVRSGVVIIDGGITRVGEKVESDADRSTFGSMDGFITPVPGGIGPVTVALLINRVAELATGKEGTGSILE